MNTDKAEEFCRGLSLMVRGGFDPMGPFTQACHETFFFEKTIGKYNFWGLKAPKWFKGKRLSVLTHEHENGVTVKVMQDFCDWDTIAEAINFYTRRIAKIYPEAFKGRRFYKLFFEGLQKGKFGAWATDPLYVEKLMTRYKQITQDQSILEIVLPCIHEFVKLHSQ